MRPDLLQKLLDKHPETEFVQLQINYVDWESPQIRSRECYEIVNGRGLPVTTYSRAKRGFVLKPHQIEEIRQIDALLKESREILGV